MRENTVFESFSCTKILLNQTSQNKVMQPTTSNNDLQPFFSYHARNQADFGNPFINGKGFIYFCISKLNSTF